MLAIKKFENKNVRIIKQKNEPWFVLKDVCEILDLTTPSRVSERLDEDEVSQTHVTDSLGRNQLTTVINESGLYTVILRSDKPQAKIFRKWVTNEVLPDIRKHGVYLTEQKVEDILNDPDTIIKLATQLKEERQAMQRLVIENEGMKPKALFADAVTASKASILVGDLAKLIKQNGVETGAKRLFQWLRDNGYLIKRQGSDYNMPTQKSMEQELFEIKETTITHSDGHISINKTPKVTGKGQVYFIKKFLESK